MTSMRLGSLFSGYGGLEQAVEAVLGTTTAWVSDIDKGACKILAHRYPDVPNLGDITAVDWSTVEPVDVLTGGFPCQDVSAAGKRAGLIHGTRSGLWHQFARAITELRPSLVVIENVRGLMTARGDTSEEYEAADVRCHLAANLREWLNTRSDRASTEGRTADARRITTRTHRLMAVQRRAVADRKRAERRIVRAIGTVLGTLADLGYDAQWYCLRASDVGAPHGRFRVFVVASDTDSTSGEAWWGRPRTGDAGRLQPVVRGDALLPTPTSSDTNGAGAHGDGGLDLRTALSLLPTPRATRGGSNTETVGLLPTPSVADAMGGHLTRSGGRSDELLLPGVAKALAENALLPTPRATDGTKGGPNQRGSSGDLMLPSAVALLPTPAVNDMGEGKTVEAWDEWTDAMQAKHGNGNGHGKSLAIEAQRLLPTPKATNNENRQSEGYGGRNGNFHDIVRSDRWGEYADAIARWETLTRPAPEPTMLSTKGTPQLSPAFSEWMMGLPAGWVTDVPGITRNEALRALGNGVVPQQAEAALRFLLSVQAVAS